MIGARIIQSIFDEIIGNTFLEFIPWYFAFLAPCDDKASCNLGGAGRGSDLRRARLGVLVLRRQVSLQLAPQLRLPSSSSPSSSQHSPPQQFAVYAHLEIC